MTEFRQVQRGRGLLPITATLFALALGACSIATRDFIFVICGAALLVVSASGIYAFWKKEEWSLQIISGTLCWSYPRFPRSLGSIPLADIGRAVIDDSSYELVLGLKSGTERKIKLVGSGFRLRDHLISHYPHIIVDYIEPIHST